ncbi:MAG: metal ABC transporter substrate-binding protein, partial [Lachnospiraceae bacterium]|nr:metal ABC transporter substrate-binding protein [Lachnospiraceae bacterium]
MKKILAVILTVILALGSLSGCGKQEQSANADKELVKALVAAVSSQKVADFIGQKYGGAVVSVVEKPTDGFDASVDYKALSGKTISVAASPTPHAEILQIAKEILAEKNIELKVIEYNDYVLPNNVVESGEVLANYFQHVPYLQDFNAENGTHIVSAAAIHVEPMGLYGGKQKSLDTVKTTSGLVIGVPNDTTNEARALLLLEANGYLKLKDGAGITATVKDITENPYGLTFTEVEAAQLPRLLPDLDYAVINSNYAIDAGLNPVAESLIIEGAASAYANIIAVKEG